MYALSFDESLREKHAFAIAVLCFLFLGSTHIEFALRCLSQRLQALGAGKTHGMRSPPQGSWAGSEKWSDLDQAPASSNL